jgi:hypothetical protein
MAITTICYGVSLMLLTVLTLMINGELGNVLSGEIAHPTQFIPTAFGVILLICGAIALKESLRKHAMHAAAVVALLGALMGLGRGVSSLVSLARGNEVNSLALAMVLGMSTILIAFLVLCIRSFRAARMARQAAEANPTT